MLLPVSNHISNSTCGTMTSICFSIPLYIYIPRITLLRGVDDIRRKRGRFSEPYTLQSHMIIFISCSIPLYTKGKRLLPNRSGHPKVADLGSVCSGTCNFWHKQRLSVYFDHEALIS